MSNHAVILISANVAIVQTEDTGYAMPETISANELSDYYGTVSLPVAPSVSVVGEQYSNIKLVFGSWAVSGDEDEQLKDLYKSRLTPSISQHD